MTSEIPEPGSVPEIRVSDAEREVVAQRLRHALAEGRLTFTEFDERVAAAYAAKTGSDLAPLTADLPRQSATGPDLPAAAPAAASPQPPVSGGGVDWTVAVMSGSERTGRWRPGRHTRAVAVMGGCELDLRQAAFPEETLVITAVAVMGGIEITVPEGVEVEVTGLSIMGGRSLKVADVPRRPGTPVVRVRAFAIMGGIDIRSKPPRKQKPDSGKRLDRA
jgi:hypothetical protein